MSQYRWWRAAGERGAPRRSTRTIDLITWNEVQDLPTVGEGELYREAQPATAASR